MKSILASLLFISSIFLYQNNEPFKVHKVSQKMGNRGNEYFNHEHFSPHLFEDDNYIIESTCKGEFGGKVIFEDKHNGQVNFCSSKCAVIVNKINSSYYISTSLRHLSPAYGLFEVTNPKELTEIKSDTIIYDQYDGMIGMKPLTFGYGKTIIISFVYQTKLYHIVSEENETYLAERENAELKKIQPLMDEEIYSVGNKAKRTKEDKYLAIFYTKTNQGYIEIEDNNITITTYE